VKLLLAICFLSIIAAAVRAEEAKEDCLIAGKVADIHGLLTYVEDDTLAYTRHAFIVKLPRARCYLYPKTGTSGWDEIDGPVTAVQITVDGDSLAPGLGPSSIRARDPAAYQAKLYRYLKSIVGKQVKVHGYVVASGGVQFTNPTISIYTVNGCPRKC